MGAGGWCVQRVSCLHVVGLRITLAAMKNRPIVLTKIVVVRLEPDLYDLVAANAEANGRTVSQSVRFILKEALK